MPSSEVISDDLEYGIGQHYLDLFQKSPVPAVQLLKKFHTSKGSGRIHLSDALSKFLALHAQPSDWTA